MKLIKLLHKFNPQKDFGSQIIKFQKFFNLQRKMSRDTKRKKSKLFFKLF